MEDVEQLPSCHGITDFDTLLKYVHWSVDMADVEQVTFLPCKNRF